MAIRGHVKLPAGAHVTHQIQTDQVAGRIVQKHVFAARIRCINAVCILRCVPAIDGGIVLHARIAALPGGFRNGTHHFASFVTLHRLVGTACTGPPIGIFSNSLHELIADTHRVIGVLEKDGTVRFAVNGAIVAIVNQDVSLLFFLSFAPDKVHHIGMIHIKDNHLGCATGFATGLDHASKGIKSSHEAERATSPTATRKNGIFFAHFRQIRARAGSPLKQHPFSLGQVQNGFQRVFYAHNKAGGTLGTLDVFIQYFYRIRGFVMIPTIAASIFHSDVEPNGRIEAGFLSQHQMGQFMTEIFYVFRCLKVAAFPTPISNRIGDAVDQLADAGFPIRRANLAMEVFTNHNVCSGLRPIGRNLYVALLKNYRSFVVSNGGGPFFPTYVVVGGLASGKLGGEMLGKRYSHSFFFW